MAKNTSVTLGDHFEEIIRKSIASGRYASVSEVIRAGLRLVEREEAKISALRHAVKEGQRSGYVEDFDPGEKLKLLRKRRGSGK